MQDVTDQQAPEEEEEYEPFVSNRPHREARDRSSKWRKSFRSQIRRSLEDGYGSFCGGSESDDRQPTQPQSHLSKYRQTMTDFVRGKKALLERVAQKKQLVADLRVEIEILDARLKFLDKKSETPRMISSKIDALKCTIHGLSVDISQIQELIPAYESHDISGLAYAALKWQKKREKSRRQKISNSKDEDRKEKMKQDFAQWQRRGFAKIKNDIVRRVRSIQPLAPKERTTQTKSKESLKLARRRCEYLYDSRREQMKTLYGWGY